MSCTACQGGQVSPSPPAGGYGQYGQGVVDSGALAIVPPGQREEYMQRQGAYDMQGQGGACCGGMGTQVGACCCFSGNIPQQRCAPNWNCDRSPLLRSPCDISPLPPGLRQGFSPCSPPPMHSIQPFYVPGGKDCPPWVRWGGPVGFNPGWGGSLWPANKDPHCY